MSATPRLENTRGVTIRLTPIEHSNLARKARHIGLENSEIAVIGLQMVMETPIEEIRKRLVPSKRAKYRYEPIRDYDPDTGQVKLPEVDALPIASGSGETGDSSGGPGRSESSDSRPRKPANKRKRGITPKNRGAEVLAHKIAASD